MSTPVDPPVYPDRAALIAQLALYVDVSMTVPSQDTAYVTQCADESKEWLDHKVDENAEAGVLPVNAYTRAFLEVGAQLFRRRRTWSNIDPLEAPAVPPVRSNPYSAAYPILEPYFGPVMA